ncbi:TPA-induced transmembrane protein homolog [Maylandia zebra]|uniref:TPA-induced transmembrane protein homolog n=1 Tax=Maylandia zebra TaxID=106582 RepID=UPI00403CB755
MVDIQMEMLKSQDEFDGAPVSRAHGGTCVTYGDANTNSSPTEAESLLQPRNGTNGVQTSSCDVESQKSGKDCTKRGIKKELNEKVFWEIRLWMVIIFILIVIIAVIFTSLAICAAIHQDEDDIFDPSSFTVIQNFRGSFQMPNQVFTDELATNSSNKSQTLATELGTKLSDLFKTSSALGRYFINAEIRAFRNGSVFADYKLTFHMPEEEKDQLRNFTLSREMVYNVFRQFLYDQESESDPMFIDPASLKMVLGN